MSWFPAYCYYSSMENLRWWWWGIKRYKRLLFPEKSAVLLINTVGRWWLVFHGAKREYRIFLWDKRHWYAADIAIPRRKRIVEADGYIHKFRRQQDVVRDWRLRERGWEVMRVTADQMRKDPVRVRKTVRKFLSGH